MNTLLALGVYPYTGGPAKSIPAFRDALQAKVISWVSTDDNGTHDLLWDDSLVVAGRNLPLFRQLLVPQSKHLKEAESLISQSDMVSIHSFWRWHIEWAYQICKKHSVPYWFVPHGGLDPYVFHGQGKIEKIMFYKLFGKKFLENASTIVCSSEREKDKILPLIDHQRVEVIPWPVLDEDIRSCVDSDRTAVRESLGISSDSVCFIYFGRLSSMKRPLETIRAFSMVNSRNAHLIVAGGESDVTVNDCLMLAERLGVKERVHVVGALEGKEKYKYLDAADIYISLSFRENFNYTAVEALGSGLSIILSPGNDLAIDLQQVSCVECLPDLEYSTVVSFLSRCVDSGAIMSGRDGRVWVKKNLEYGAFRSRVQGLRSNII